MHANFQFSVPVEIDNTAEFLQGARLFGRLPFAEHMWHNVQGMPCPREQSMYRAAAAVWGGSTSLHAAQRCSCRAQWQLAVVAMAAILQAIEQLEIITTGLATPAVEPRRDLIAVCEALHLAVTAAKTDGFRPGQEEVACRSVLRTHVAPDTRPGTLSAWPGQEHAEQGR